MAGLTAYLLDRERQHWTRLYETRAEVLEFGTPPTAMARTVFAAALTGAVSHREGTAILTRLDIDGQVQRILADHSACYPSAYPAHAAVLEPLYPDRLAEDYLALSLTGHDISGCPPDPWTDTALAALLICIADMPAPGYTPRAVTFLTAATARWPHLGTRHLYPLLRQDPGLALRGGSTVLTTLADLPAPVDLLAAIAAHFPDREQADLDVGIAAVTRCRQLTLSAAREYSVCWGCDPPRSRQAPVPRWSPPRSPGRATRSTAGYAAARHHRSGETRSQPRHDARESRHFPPAGGPLYRGAIRCRGSCRNFPAAGEQLIFLR